MSLLLERWLFVDDPVAEFGNSFGHIALWSMSFFLLVVARHSPLLQLLEGASATCSSCRLVSSNALLYWFHIWPGRIVVISALVHGIVHMYRWKVRVGVSLVSMIVPSLHCWRIMGRTENETENTSSSTTSACLDPITGCSCYAQFRNLSGLCAALAMLLIGVTSLYKLRRWSYRIFYLCHATLSPLAMLFLCLHFTRSLVYMAPSVLYYVASSFPFFAETILKSSARGRGGVRILSCQQLGGGDDNNGNERGHQQPPCVALLVEASHLAMEQYKPCQHVLLRAPSLSMVSHPFTVNRVMRGDGDDNLSSDRQELFILFRPSGGFTKSLASVLLQCDDDDASPMIHMDGFHGSSRRLDDALVDDHDVVILIAGGIGIVAYLSLLDDIIRCSASAVNTNSTSNEQVRNIIHHVELHWMCRDANLVRFVWSEYLEKLRDRARHAGTSLQIVIHATATSSNLTNENIETNTTGTRTTRIACNGEPFSPYRFSTICTRGFGYSGSFITYTLNIGIGAATGWCAGANALKEEDEAATVWSLVCIFGIGLYVFVLAWKMDSRYFATFTAVVWPGLFFIYFFYLTFQEENSRILARVWSPICILLVAAAVATLSVYQGDSLKSLRYESVVQSNSDDGVTMIELGHVDESDPGDRRANCSTRAGIMIGTTDSSSDSCASEIVIEYGRPSIHNLLTSTTVVGRVAVFACGPATLMKDVRLSVRALRRGTCCRKPHRIDLYEESFEI